MFITAVCVIFLWAEYFCSGHKWGRDKWQILVINRVRVLVTGPHTPTQFFWEYPPGPELGSISVACALPTDICLRLRRRLDFRRKYRSKQEADTSARWETGIDL